MILNLLILSLVTLERSAELPLAASNTRRLIAQGASEHAPRHYPLIVALHVAWLATLWWLAPWQAIHLFPLAVFVLLEFGRAWVLTTLGRRWTTRIIVLPGAPLVRRGPYRFIHHPNYVIVAGEILVLPLVFGMWRTAILFSVLNAALLAVRIRQENRALSEAHLG
jgi:methyltransferase